MQSYSYGEHFRTVEERKFGNCSEILLEYSEITNKSLEWRNYIKLNMGKVSEMSSPHPYFAICLSYCHHSL